MKVLITGTHGTGKSSLLLELKKLPELKDFKFIGGVTREIKDLGFPINEEGTWKTQLLCIAKDVINLLENENKNIVFDRSILDTMVYTDYLFNNSFFNREFIQTVNIVSQIFLLLRSSFDLIIWLRPEFDLKGDGTRSQSKLFQKDIDKKFNELIIVDNKYVFQLTGSVEERVEQFKKIYNEKIIRTEN